MNIKVIGLKLFMFIIEYNWYIYPGLSIMLYVNREP